MKKSSIAMLLLSTSLIGGGSVLAAGNLDEVKQIQAIPTEHAKTTVPAGIFSRASLSTNQQKVLNCAKSLIGTPFVSGGTSPSTGFDASGFVQYVYQKAVNITLPRTTVQQQAVGKPVALNQLQPGDLVFYGYPNSYCVAIYMGNNTIIFSPKPGESVKTLNMSYYEPNYAVRVLGNVQPSQDTSKPQATVFDSSKMTVTNSSFTIWKDLSFNKKAGTTQAYYNQTVTTNRYYMIQGKKYYSVYDKNNNWIGYVYASAFTPVGTAMNETMTITAKNQPIYSNLSLTKTSGKSDAYVNKNVVVKRRYMIDGQLYYSAYTSSGDWIGYINAESFKEANKPVAHRCVQKMTVTKKDGVIWGNLSFNSARSTTEPYYNKVVNTKYYYDIADERYYSIYDDNDQWIGYVNEDALALYGTPVNQQYMTVTKSNQPIYDSKTFTTHKGNTSAYLNKTLQVKYEYQYMGQSYESVYDNKGNWVGYINKNALTQGNGQGGVMTKQVQYLSVVKSGYSLWNDLSFSAVRTPADKAYQVTFKSVGYYNHFNGSRYYSLYNKDNQWMGYVNANGTKIASTKGGAAYACNTKKKVVNGNYTLWNDFNFSKSNGTLSRYKGKTVTVKYIYHHFNGSTYTSVYNGNTWLGYVNEAALS